MKYSCFSLNEIEGEKIMKKFYYALNNNAYIELDDMTYDVLNLCIDIISSRLEEHNEDISVNELLISDKSAILADKVIKTILTEEQYEKYKIAILY